jgi:hypothetical protein
MPAGTLQQKNPGDPCPGCGCPYPGDHTQDCQWQLTLDAFRTIHRTIGNVFDAVKELHKIVQIQQKQINKLTDERRRN